mgnify:FL=1
MVRQIAVELDEDTYEAVRRLAYRRKIPVARYLSDFLHEYARDEWIDDPDWPEISGRPKRQYPPHAVASDVPVRRHVRRRA